MSLHLLEFPREIPLADLSAAFDALGVPMSSCRGVTLRIDGFSADVQLTDLAGRFVGWTTIDVPVRPGRDVNQGSLL